MFALLEGGVRVRVGIGVREQRKIKRRSKALPKSFGGNPRHHSQCTKTSIKFLSSLTCLIIPDLGSQ